MDRAVRPGGRVSRDGRLPAGDPGPRRTEAAAMTTTAATCTQPGCGGTIDGGYCTVCGMAAAPVPVPAPVPVTVSQGLGSLPSMSGSGGHAGSRGTRAAASGSSRGNLGAGLVDIPPGPAHDPRSAGPAAARGRGPAGSGSSRGTLGAGLVDIPPVPAHDPVSAVLADPQVAESKRFWPRCEHPVGRAP